MTLILAIIPVLLLIILMAFFKMPGDKSSIISLVVTMLIALFGFTFSVDNLFYSFLYGALKAVSPILIIILMAIFSYNVLLKTEKMEIIKQQFASISTDKSIQVLLLTWGFGGLLEAMAGFGTAVAIPAAILISLGFKPIFSATVSLIANSVATAFGAIGTPVLVLAKETNLDVLNLSTNVVLQLSVLMFLIPFVLLFLTDPKLKSLPKNLFLALLVGSVSLISQYLAARYMGAESPAIIGSILSIIVIVLYGKLTASKEEKARKSSLKTKDILNAWSIYLLILVLIILTSPLFPGLRHTLENNWITKISLPINASTVNYTILWLTHAGVLLFVGTFIGGLIQGAKGLVHRTLEYGETVEKNFRHGYLPGRIIHHYGRFGNDCRYCHGTRHCYRKFISAVRTGHRLPGNIYYRKRHLIQYPFRQTASKCSGTNSCQPRLAFRCKYGRGYGR